MVKAPDGIERPNSLYQSRSCRRQDSTERDAPGYLTTASNDTWPEAPGAITPGRSHLSSVEPTRFSAVEKSVPFGPFAEPLTYSNRGRRLSTIDADRIGVFP